MSGIDRVAPSSDGRWRRFGIAFAVLFALMSLWSLASPLMSSPDEPAHAMRAAAVVRGDVTGVPSSSTPGTTDVIAPRYLAGATDDLACYRRDILQTAACQVFGVDDPDRLVVAHTTAGSNTPVFYVLTGWPTLFLSGQTAMYAMRLCSVLICSVLLAGAYAVLRRPQRSRWSAVAFAVAVSPMMLFLGGTLNPNGLEAAAAIASLVSLLALLQHASTSRVFTERVALVTVSSSLLATTRTIALLWLALIVVVALVLARRDLVLAVVRRPIAWAGAALVAVTAIGSLLYFVLSPKGLILSYQPIGAGASYSDGFLTTFDRTFDFSAGWIGLFGWLDTPAPGLTMICWSITAGVLVLVAVVGGSLRDRLALSVLVLAALLVPPFTQASVVFEVGYIWQGRYTLAVFMMVLIVCGNVVDGRTRGLSRAVMRRITVTVATVLALGHLTAFVWALKRYVVSLSWDFTWIDMVLRPQWQPPLGWILLACAYAVAIAGGAIVFIRDGWSTEPASDRLEDVADHVGDAPAVSGVGPAGTVSEHRSHTSRS